MTNDIRTLAISMVFIFIAATTTSSIVSNLKQEIQTTEPATIRIKDQNPIAEDYPEIVHNPEAIKNVQLKHLQKILPQLEAIPEDWTSFQPQQLIIRTYDDTQYIFERGFSPQKTNGLASATYYAQKQKFHIELHMAATKNTMTATFTRTPKKNQSKWYQKTLQEVFTITIEKNEATVTTQPYRIRNIFKPSKLWNQNLSTPKPPPALETQI
jgi:hypothetical protein